MAIEVVYTGVLRLVLAGQDIAGEAAVNDFQGTLLRGIKRAPGLAIEGAAVQAQNGAGVAVDGAAPGVDMGSRVS